jgi:DNA-binding Lrp family transcriptional regulator
MTTKSIQKLNCLDVYRYFCVSLTAIKGETNITYEQIEILMGKDEEHIAVSSYKSSGKQKSFADKMNELDEVTVTKEYSKTPNNGIVRRNIYRINYSTEHKLFRMPEKELLLVDLEPKLKGYILKLFSVCNVNTLIINMTQKDLCELINLSPATVNKYNKILFEKGYLVDLGDCFKINIAGIAPIVDKKYEEQVRINEKFLETLLDAEYMSKGIEVYKKLKETNFDGVRDKLAILQYCASDCKTGMKVDYSQRDAFVQL